MFLSAQAHKKACTLQRHLQAIFWLGEALWDLANFPSRVTFMESTKLMSLKKNYKRDHVDFELTN